MTTAKPNAITKISAGRHPCPSQYEKYRNFSRIAHSPYIKIKEQKLCI
jgi:hypothetical protein